MPLSRNPPPLFQNRRPKIYYGTQVGIQPPTLVMFCNEPRALGRPYQRYLLGAVREQAALRRGAQSNSIFVKPAVERRNRDEDRQTIPTRQ